MPKPDGPDSSFDSSMRFCRHLAQPGRLIAAIFGEDTGLNSGMSVAPHWQFPPIGVAQWPVRRPALCSNLLIQKNFICEGEGTRTQPAILPFKYRPFPLIIACGCAMALRI
jgi:hypothetical protein